MAAPRVCPRCETAHYNFQPCRWRENQKLNVSFPHVTPNLPEGWRVWGEHLKEFERRGEMTMLRSGMARLSPHPGKVIEPREEE